MSDNITTEDVNAKAYWHRHLMEKFCDICLKYKHLGHHSGNNFSPRAWKSLVAEFNKEAGVEYTHKQLRNKWDQLRGDYKNWKWLKSKATGLGWDPMTNTVVATREFWMAIEKERPKVKKFKTSGIEPDLEEKYEEMFHGVISQKDYAYSPSSGTLPSRNGPIEIQNLDDGSEDLSEGAIRNIDLDEPANHFLHENDCSKQKRKVEESNMLTKTRKQGGGRKLSSQIDRFCNLMESKITAAATKKDPLVPTIREVVELLDNMPDIDVGGKLYLFAVTRLLDIKEKREMFVSLKPAVRLSWLKAEAENVGIKID